MSTSNSEKVIREKVRILGLKHDAITAKYDDNQTLTIEDAKQIELIIDEVQELIRDKRAVSKRIIQNGRFITTYKHRIIFNDIASEWID